MRNTHSHPNWVVRMPPTTGPAPAAMLPIAVVMPNTWARCSTGYSGSTSAVAVGTINAPPIAWTTRPMTSTIALGARPHSSDAAVKITLPRRNARLRPNASAIRPAVSRPAANAIE